LGRDTVDGKSYLHYRTDIKIEDVMSSLGELFGQTIPTDVLSGPMTMDMWLDPDGYLPYKYLIAATFNASQQSMGFQMTMRYLDYNKPVPIPTPPPNAKPYTP